MNDSKNDSKCQTVAVFSVYVLWCNKTNKHYVGVTRQKKVWTRIRQHKRGKQFIDREIQKISWDGNWDWWIVEEGVPSNLITEREQYWVAFFDSVYPNGYNKTRGGVKYFEYAEEIREKMSKSHLGQKRAPFTAEHRANISESRTGEKNPNYGKPARNRGVPCTEETKSKIRQKLTGRKRPDQSERMKGDKNPNFGRHMSEETRAKLSEATRGRPAWNKNLPCSEEQRAVLREKALERDMSGKKNPFYGRHHTEEAREKNRQAHLGKPGSRKGIPCSEETKAKLREKALARVAAKRAAQMTP